MVFDSFLCEFHSDEFFEEEAYMLWLKEEHMEDDEDEWFLNKFEKA